MSIVRTAYAFSPTTISNCSLWLDAADSSTITGTTTVTAWTDKSGNGNHAAFDTNKPSYTAANRYIETTNNNTHIRLPSAAFTNTTNQTCIIFIIYADKQEGNNNQALFSTLDYGLYQLLRGPSYAPYNIRGNITVDASYTAFKTSLMTTNTVLYSIQYTAGITGAENYSVAPFGNYWHPISQNYQYITSDIYLGGVSNFDNSGDFHANLKINEVIAYNNIVLTTTQRQQVESYLGQKWGLTSSLVAGHPGRTSRIYRSDYLVPNRLKPTPYYTQFSPRQILGCSLWLDAADSSTITLSGSNVTNVADKSGNGVVLSNATGFTYPNRSFNGTYPSFLCLNGGGGQANAAATLGYNSAFAQTTPFTVFFVSHQTQAGVGYIMDSQSGGNRQYTYNNTLSTPFGNSGADVTSTPSVVSMTWISGTSVLYLNGTSSYSGALGSFTTGGIIVGNRFSINESWPGHICELIYYSGQLGTTQRQQVESYLAQKWGLTASLPGGHSHLTQPAGAVTTVAKTKFKITGLPGIIFASTGLVITHQDGRTWKATANNPGYANYAIGLNSGTSMSLNIYAGGDVFNSAGGRVALLYNGDTNNAVRHAGYVMWTSTFAANNFDFGWKFVSSGSGYLIYNDYPSIGSAWQVTYDSGQDRVLIQPPGAGTYGMVWNITPRVTLAYVYSSY